MTSPDTEFISILGAPSGTDTVITRSGGKSLPEVLPILGLSDIVIFPGMVAPLLVDTAQSIRLIDDVVEGDRLLGLVLQRKPELDTPTPEELRQDLCAVPKKCGPDWDITTPEMKVAWQEGRKDAFYPCGKTHVQTLAEQD